MRSKGAERVYKALRSLGSYRVQEEHAVGERLRLDFYVPELRLGVEVDGIQHDQFSSLFYDSKDAFRAAQARDRRKEQLCSEASITLIRLDYNTIMKAKSAEDLSKIILDKINEAHREEDEW